MVGVSVLSDFERLALEIDSQERLRTRGVRRMLADKAMLQDALGALRDGRVEVTEEFLERTIQAIRVELEVFREWNGPGDGC